MKPEQRMHGRVGSWIIAVTVVVVVMGALWIAVTMSGLSADNSRLEQQATASERKASTRDQQLRDLAAQVRKLGGTPVVVPPPGVAGSPGVAGQPGAPGRPGAAGSPGRSGGAGSPGPTGPAGPSGTQGAAGAPGQAVTGPPGPAGPTGPAGKDGKDGTDGKDGSPPSSFSWTYLGVTYQCTPTSDDSTAYDCQPAGAGRTAR